MRFLVKFFRAQYSQCGGYFALRNDGFAKMVWVWLTQDPDRDGTDLEEYFFVVANDLLRNFEFFGCY